MVRECGMPCVAKITTKSPPISPPLPQECAKSSRNAHPATNSMAAATTPRAIDPLQSILHGLWLRSTKGLQGTDQHPMSCCTAGAITGEWHLACAPQWVPHPMSPQPPPYTGVQMQTLPHPSCSPCRQLVVLVQSYPRGNCAGSTNTGHDTSSTQSRSAARVSAESRQPSDAAQSLVPTREAPPTNNRSASRPAGT